ncbi:TATA-box binding [Thermanaeromonas toyohensis ToBE]|uniref:TATA-box binding n=1 Tax=Thermanaeromonas toyohensis ToBE TaxID=698762 RepID=A0A1W1W3L1_9FIRM|nr:YwmB family TATA-box binding protein [Thermanaeromonas toyohensis]SMC00083.1 TATA-box binding [Thermanaeromonas toyohensis ToBE]
MGIHNEGQRKTWCLVGFALIFSLILSGFLTSKLLSKGETARFNKLHGATGMNFTPVTAKEVPELLARALEVAGAQGDSVRLEAWGILSPTFLDLEELLKKARETAQDLGLKGDLPWKKENQPGFRSVSWEGKIEPGTLLYLAVQSLKDLSGKGETYLLLSWEGNIGGKGVAAQIQEWQERATRVFGHSRTEPRYTYMLTGRIPGYLSLEERKEKVQSVLSILKASKIEGLEEEELLSITAYSPLLPQKVEVAGQKANLNVALRFHASDGTTYLYLGSPLLAGEY